MNLDLKMPSIRIKESAKFSLIFMNKDPGKLEKSQNNHEHTKIDLLCLCLYESHAMFLGKQ